MARLVVEATADSETEFKKLMQRSWRRVRKRKLKHNALPRLLSRDVHDARQKAHVKSRSRSGETVDHVH